VLQRWRQEHGHVITQVRKFEISAIYRDPCCEFLQSILALKSLRKSLLLILQ